MNCVTNETSLAKEQDMFMKHKSPLNSFPNNKFYSSKLKDDNLKFDANDKILLTGGKHCEKMSNFSFSHSVFKRVVLRTRKNQGLFGKG